MSKGLPTEAIELEQAVAPILSRQQRYGYLFDQEKARELECILVSRRTALEAELRKVIPPWKVVKRKFVPKRDDKRRGYVKGVEVTTYKDVVFNPASRQHIADRLTAMYGWQPQEFTEKGQPKIDEEVLGALCSRSSRSCWSTSSSTSASASSPKATRRGSRPSRRTAASTAA